MKRLRAEFQERSRRFVLEHLRFIDETGMNLALTRLYGRAAPGVRVVYLSPYSPDLNPIEKCWAKIKTALRHAKARTRTRLDTALKQALPTITTTDALAWFAHCGYPVH